MIPNSISTMTRMLHNHKTKQKQTNYLNITQQAAGYKTQKGIKEELGIMIKVLEPFEVSSFIYDKDKQVILLGFYCSHVSGEIQKKDISDFSWVSPKELEDYDITEADLPFIKKLSPSD